MNELALFAGAGGGILGGHLLGWRTICAVEWEPYPASTLCARQNDGILSPFPIWDDICTFDGRPWRGIVDVVSGGFPCQDISVAGAGAGIEGERSGLWKEMARVIREVRPRFAFVENSPELRKKGLDVVLKDLAEIGYDAEWGVLSASDVGADIERARIWILASPSCEFGEPIQRPLFFKKGGNLGGGKPPRYTISRFVERLALEGEQREVQRTENNLPPYLCELSDGLAPELDELKAVGNGQVPTVAAAAFCLLYERLIRKTK